MNINEQAPLGERVRDLASGYEGTCVAITVRWHGPIQVAVERRDQNGKPEEVWFYPERLAEVAALPPGQYA